MSTCPPVPRPNIDDGRPPTARAQAYPTTTYKNFLINLPAAGAAGPIVKAFAPARSAKKFVLLGVKFQDELHAHVDVANLPRKLGGQLDDGLQWSSKKKK